MKAIPLLLIGLAFLMAAQPLQPVSAIDFGPALHLKKNNRNVAIWMLSACPDGSMVAGGPPSIMTATIARSHRTGSAVTSFDLRGAEWWRRIYCAAGQMDPSQPVTRGIVDTTALPHGTTRSGPVNYDLYTRDGRYLKSFRVVAALSASIRPLGLPLSLAASADEIVISYGNLIRAGHISSGDFVGHREWHVNGSPPAFTLHHDRFAVVNHMTGEFAIINPSTPATQTVAVPFKSATRRDRLPITAAEGSIWFLVDGALGNKRDLVQCAPDGSMASRKIAISGRDVYLAGVTATVYRYELP